jgi:hypothetical protein
MTTEILQSQATIIDRLNILERKGVNLKLFLLDLNTIIIVNLEEIKDGIEIDLLMMKRVPNTLSSSDMVNQEGIPWCFPCNECHKEWECPRNQDYVENEYLIVVNA